MSGSSPTVGLSDANGSANTVRPTGMDYPSGRSLTYDYGSSGGISDHASRIASLIDNDGTTHLADYSFLGLGAIVGGPGCESSRYRGDEAEGGKVRQSRPIGLLSLRDPGSRRNGNRGHPRYPGHRSFLAWRDSRLVHTANLPARRLFVLQQFP